MNSQCLGDYFYIPGRDQRFYRCFRDGSIVPSPTTGFRQCPECDRPVVANEQGEVAVDAGATVAILEMPRGQRVQVLVPG